MDNYYRQFNGNGFVDNGHAVARINNHDPRTSLSLSWLDLRVFYVRVSRCEIDSSTPEHLGLNHTPLHPDTILEVNGVRTGIDSDGLSLILRRDRIDKISEEATFVCTDSVRMTGTVKFQVLDKDVLILSGILELCDSNGSPGESRNHTQRWSMSCESHVTVGTSFLKVNHHMGPESPMLEVYVAGSFSGAPLILLRTLQLIFSARQMREYLLNSIPEDDANESLNSAHSGLPLQLSEYSIHKPEDDDYNLLYSETEYFEGEDEELSWFNAGVRVGVGIGLSICLGVGIGVGLLVRTYQGTISNFRRRLL